MFTRRHLLQSSAVGFPMLALRSLLESDTFGQGPNPLASRLARGA